VSEVAGRIAVVTGASRGLGAGLAEAFAADGLRLGLCARSAPVLPSGADVVAARLDVTDAAAAEAFAADVAARLGPIDLWVNNAGVLEPITPLRNADPAALARNVDVNVTGVLLGSRAFVRHLHGTGRPGVLINISSGAARKPYAGWSAYCAAKAGVDRLTECLDEEERAHGLRAYSVAPGVIDTEMQARIRASTAEDFPQVARFHTMKRDDDFYTPRFIASRLLELAFDPAHAPQEGEILLRL